MGGAAGLTPVGGMIFLVADEATVASGVLVVVTWGAAPGAGAGPTRISWPQSHR